MNTKNLFLLGLITTTLCMTSMYASEVVPVGISTDDAIEKLIHEVYKNQDVSKVSYLENREYAATCYSSTTQLHNLLLGLNANNEFLQKNIRSVADYLVSNGCRLDVKAARKIGYKFYATPSEVTVADLITEALEKPEGDKWQPVCKRYSQAIKDKTTLVGLCQGIVSVPPKIHAILATCINRDPGSTVMAYIYSPEEYAELEKLKALIAQHQ